MRGVESEIRGGYADEVYRHITCHGWICNGNNDTAGKHDPVKNEVRYEQLPPLLKKQETACDTEKALRQEVQQEQRITLLAELCEGFASFVRAEQVKHRRLEHGEEQGQHGHHEEDP